MRASFLASVLASGLAAGLSGCATHTLFQSRFNEDTVATPPSHVQATGTIDVTGAPGSVQVVAGPVTPTEHWARLVRQGEQAPVTTMQCRFARIEGAGRYHLVAAVWIPAGSGLATLAFDTAPTGSPPDADFLHLDFLQDGTVRMDDDPGTIWGHWPHDRTFTLAVTLDVPASGAGAVAHLALLGNGASGERDQPVAYPALARQVGSVKFWIGYPWQGSFQVTDVLVTKDDR